MKYHSVLMIVICALLLQASSLFAQDNSGSGTVAETMDVGSYVYVRLEENDTWLASSSVEVSVGDTVEFSGGALMKNFHSSRLDRTFEDIVFAAELKVADKASDAGQIEATHGPTGKHAQMAGTVAVPSPGEISPLDVGHTVAQVFADYRELNGRQVRLRARVMKVSANIMGKNWVTLQDGTGTAPENRLMATTQESVAPGETVVVSGVLANDVSLGFGYDYKALLEEASFQR